MFGIIVKSKTVASLVSAGVLASVLLAPAAFAASAGNSFEIPPLKDTQAYYSTGTPTNIAPAPRMRHTAPPVVERSTTNPSCPGGYTWSESMAGNGMSIPVPCHG